MSFSASVDDLVKRSDDPLLQKASDWTRRPLASVSRVVNGFPFKSTHFTETPGTPVIRIRDVTAGEAGTFYSGPVPDGYWVEPGDIVIGMDGDFNCRIWTGQRALLNQRVCKLEIDPSLIDKRFLAYVLPGYLRLINEETHSITVKHLSSRTIGEVPLPYPEPTEQKQIADALDGLLSHVDSAREEIARARKIVERYKLAVLGAAFRGELTVDWRQAHGDVEPASKLLRRIKEVRLAQATTVKDTKQIEAAFSAPSINDDEAESIPQTWASSSVGCIGSVCNGSTPSRGEPAYWNGNIPWVSSGEVRNERILATREGITPDGFANSSLRMLPKGTVLLAMIGEGKTRGQTAVLCIEATINQNVAAVIIEHGLIRPELLRRWFQFQYEQTRRRGAGNGPKALNCQAVRDLPFTLPPFDEQEQVVYAIEVAFARIDEAAAEATRAEDLLARLQTLTLAKAVSGELIRVRRSADGAEARAIPAPR